MKSPLNAIILAGGHSVRMGQNKATLAYYGQPHVQYLAKLLTPFVHEVFISIREEQIKDDYLKDLHCITDYYTSPSPLNGIVSAMRAHPSMSLLVVAVDMPYINAISIQKLIESRNPAAIATCFESPSKGGPDPLFAIWEAHAFPQLEALLKNETRHVCPRKVLQSLPTHILSEAIASYILENVNTPEEWTAFQTKAS